VLKCKRKFRCLKVKNAAVHKFNTQFQQEYILIDLICSFRRKFIWTTNLL